MTKSAQEHADKAICAIFNRLFLKVRLAKEMAELESDQIGSKNILLGWADAIESSLRSGDSRPEAKAPGGKNIFLSVFNDLQIFERLLKLFVLGGSSKLQIGVLSYMFSMCFYGSEDFYFWFLKQILPISAALRESLGDLKNCAEVDQFLSAITAFLKLPSGGSGDDFFLLSLQIDWGDKTEKKNLDQIGKDVETANENIRKLVEAARKVKSCRDRFIFSAPLRCGDEKDFFDSIKKRVRALHKTGKEEVESKANRFRAQNNTPKSVYRRRVIAERVKPLLTQIEKRKIEISEKEKMAGELEKKLLETREEIGNLRKEEKELEIELKSEQLKIEETVADFYKDHKKLGEEIRVARQKNKAIELFSSFISEVELKFKNDYAPQRKIFENIQHKNYSTLLLQTRNLFSLLSTLSEQTVAQICKIKNFFSQINSHFQKALSFEISCDDKNLYRMNSEDQYVQKLVSRGETFLRKISFCVEKTCLFLSEAVPFQLVRKELLDKLDSNVLRSLNLDEHFESIFEKENEIALE